MKRSIDEFGGKWDTIPADVEPVDLKPDGLIHYVKDFPKSPAVKILDRAANLIDGERDVQHGNRKDCHTAIARLWTAYLGVQVTATDVALLMALLKIARTQNGSRNEDCFVDGAGYMALAGELSGDYGC